MNLTERSRKNLVGVHPDLVRLVEEVAERTSLPFIITEGLRTAERQKELLEKGKSKTMNSRHLTGHAIDFAVVKDGKVTWEFQYYKQLADLFKQAARDLRIDITWGGDWTSFKDGTHIQLSWNMYPLTAKPKTVKNSKTVAAAAVGFPIAAFIPEAFAAISEFVGYLTDINEDLVKWAQITAVIAIAAFIIHERVIKIDREGV